MIYSFTQQAQDARAKTKIFGHLALILEHVQPYSADQASPASLVLVTVEPASACLATDGRRQTTQRYISTMLHCLNGQKHITLPKS